MHLPGAQVRKYVHPASKLCTPGAGCTLKFEHCNANEIEIHICISSHWGCRAMKYHSRCREMVRLDPHVQDFPGGQHNNLLHDYKYGKIETAKFYIKHGCHRPGLSKFPDKLDFFPDKCENKSHY